MKFPMENVAISPAPFGLEVEYFEIFTEKAIVFVSELISEFQERTRTLLRDRKIRKLTFEKSGKLPRFSVTSQKLETIESEEVFRDGKSLNGTISNDWTISPLPDRLKNRHLDLGDISPSETALFKAALRSNVQGIQVDFDDGHCPTWTNMIQGIHNVISVVKNKFHPDEVPPPDQCPLLLLRPRAWNMNEHNFMVNGKEVPGPLLDFGLLIYHIGKKTEDKEIGPYFYLPKLEGAKEARLWNDIFTWAEAKLSLTPSTIKACVLIENILAAFEMEEILFELRHHSMGLNCGISDYTASIVNNFGTDEKFILPDRDKYVNMDTPYLKNYMKRLVQICHKHGAPATGGMIPFILSSIPETEPAKRNELIKKINAAKTKEIELGVDGFLLYDPSLVPFMVDLWKQSDGISKVDLTNFKVMENDLLEMPHGGVTFEGLQKNIKVGLLFNYFWLADAKGCFTLDGKVEDTASADISRSQVWQWIYHSIHLEDHIQQQINKSLVTKTASDICKKLIQDDPSYDEEVLWIAFDMLLELVTSYQFPEFNTTYLYNSSYFRKLHKC